MRYLLPLMLVCGAAGAADITVDVRNVQHAGGQLELTLYQSPGQFLKPAPSVRVAAQAGETSVSFRNLPEGEYALALYHDANGNGKLDVNAFGVPTEQYAFSNDARGMMGPPSFTDARFKLGAGGARLQVSLR